MFTNVTARGHKKILFFILLLGTSSGCNHNDGPLSINAVIQKDDINVLDQDKQNNAMAEILIKNISREPQEIGATGSCCLHELNNLISDNGSIDIISGNANCIAKVCSEQKILLYTGETWEQTCQIGYKGEIGKPGQYTFRVGIIDVVNNGGQQITWSNPIKVNVVDKGR